MRYALIKFTATLEEAYQEIDTRGNVTRLVNNYGDRLADTDGEGTPFEYEVIQYDVTPVFLIAAPSTKLTKLAFRNRFTQTEKVTMEIAALDNPAATMQVRSMSAALRANMKDLEVASFIDVTRADTIAGVQMLEAAGLIGVGRAAVILSTVISETEAYNG